MFIIVLLFLLVSSLSFISVFLLRLSLSSLSGILYHRGVQKILLAYSMARPAVLVAGEGTGGMLLFLHFHSFPSFFLVSHFHLLSYLFYMFSPFLKTPNDPQGLTCR